MTGLSLFCPTDVIIACVFTSHCYFLGHINCFGKGLYFYSFKCHIHVLTYPVNNRKSF